jgi:hypothetical protein
MDTATTNSFFDELEKISQEVPDNLITPQRFKRFLGAAGAGALGAGIGYGVGHLVGAPLEQKVVELGIRRGPARVLRYALPTAAGLGAALSLARTNLRNELFKKVRGEDAKRDTGSRQQSG